MDLVEVLSFLFMLSTMELGRVGFPCFFNTKSLVQDPRNTQQKI